MRFRQFLDAVAGEKVVLVDDILRSGALLSEAGALLEFRGAQVAALAVLIRQPTPKTHSLGSIPLYYLARIEASYYADSGSCELCRREIQLYRVALRGKWRNAKSLLSQAASKHSTARRCQCGQKPVHR